MSGQNVLKSSTSMQSAKSSRSVIKANQQLQGAHTSTISSEPELVSPPSHTRIREIYKEPGFKLAWDNSVRFQLSRQFLYLRRFRKHSQQRVAQDMGSSQSAVARIENGAENVTADTAERMINALDGRLHVWITPKEVHFPQWGAWWDLVDGGIASTTVYVPKGIVALKDNGAMKVLAGWAATAGGTCIAETSTAATLLLTKG